MSDENSTSGALKNSGASRSENGTGTPPAPRTAEACDRARRSPRVRATQRSGCGIAVMTPKSGQVPTTTTAPLRRNLPHRGAEPRRGRRDAVDRGDVVGADHDDRGVGR